MLLRAFREVEDATLVLIGDGSEREQLRSLARGLELDGRIVWQEWSDDVRSYLPAFDVFVLPSRFEGFPLVVLEALLAETAVVATNVGSVPEAVRHEETGLLFRPTTPPRWRRRCDGCSPTPIFVEYRAPRASARARPVHGAAHGALLPCALRRAGPVSLHRVDPRFVLPHRVSRAVVLDGLEEWRAGLESAGIEVSDESSDRRPPDLVVSPARLAPEARHTKARSIIVEGSRERPFRGATTRPGDSSSGRHASARRWRCRSTSRRPSRTRWNAGASSTAVGRRRGCGRRASSLRAGAVPSWASPVVTVATHAPGPPALVAAAGELGVPSDVSWFLTFGQGDALSRNAFQLFRAGSDQPEWVLKFARVAGYSERFDNDERGLQFAHAAGHVIAAHVPHLVGRFDLDGVHASVETAAAGRRLRDVLLTPGDRTAKLRLIERIGRLDPRARPAHADFGGGDGRGARATPDRRRPEVERARRALGIGGRASASRAVAQHNDLGTWNVVADNGDFVVVDWENAREAALPLWDLLYFLGDAFVLLDGPVS